MSYDDSVPRASQIAPPPEVRVSIPQTWPPAPQPTTSRAQSESPSIWHGYDAFHIHPRHNYDTRPYLYDANHLTFAQRTHPPATDRTPSASPTTHPSTSTTSSTVCAFALRLSQSHFTGKERDSESGNDYFGARYYASSMGRFSSPDPQGNSYADFSNPQSWNMYAYVMNNPLKYTDPTGMYCDYSDHDDPQSGFDSSQFDYHSNSGECGTNGGQWVDDAYTHGGFDDAGRPDEAVSTNTQASNSPQPTTGDAWQDIKTTIPGLQDDAVNWAFSTFFPSAGGPPLPRHNTEGAPSLRLFSGARVGNMHSPSKPYGRIHLPCPRA